MFNKKVDMGSDPSPDPVIDVLQRLWQTKINSIAVLEKWLSETRDGEIHAGIVSQLVDERRHVRMVGEQIRLLGGRIAHHAAKDAATRVFDEARASTDDVERLFALYRGVKAYTLDRCSHLIPSVDNRIALMLESLSRDEERHIRWADVRLHRLLTHDKMRDCNLLLGRVRTQLETAWGRQWRQLSLNALRRHA